jgi:hypothetical protein
VKSKEVKTGWSNNYTNLAEYSKDRPGSKEGYFSIDDVDDIPAFVKLTFFQDN